MLNFQALSSDQLTHYYVLKDGTAKQDYYCSGQEEMGRWFGKGAEQLGLTGWVNRDHFHQLAKNINPQTNQRLTLRNKVNRKPAWDIVLDVPKDLSILCEVYGDRRIEFAHKRAVEKVLQEIQGYATVTVRKDDAVDFRHTDSLVAARFLHRTTRPLDDGTPDAHLHEHVVVFNATYDGAEDAWKSLQTMEIGKRLAMFQASYHEHLARETRELGYEIEKRGIAFGVKDFPDSLREKHSRRDSEIRAERKRRGITSDKEAAKLARLTRNSKNTDDDRPIGELRGEWRGRGSDDEEKFAVDTIAASKAKAVRQMQEVHPPAPRETDELERKALEFALLEKLGRKSAVCDWELFQSALEFGVVDDLDRRKLLELIETDPHLIRERVGKQVMITTPEVLSEERAILTYARDGRGKASALAPRHGIKDKRLSEQQRTAVNHVLNSRDRVISITGRAGVGKTTLMKEAVEAMEANGHHVHTFAPTGQASRVVLRGDGFEDATTVAALLCSPRIQADCKNGVIWIDEAGLLSVPTMNAIFEKAEALNARVVLSGDPMQHTPVERGNAMELLLKRQAIDTATVSEVKRQTGVYKEVVELISRGHTTEAVEKLDAIGGVAEIDDESRFEVLASNYVYAIRKGQTSLVVSPTHREIEKVTDAIRHHLKEGGELTSEREFKRLRRVDLGEGKQRSPHFYEPGFVLQAVKPSKGVETGERLEVIEVLTGGLVVRDKHGHNRLLDVDKLGARFQAYRTETIEIAKGEQLKITNGGRHNGHRLENGTIYEVKGFDRDGDIKLTNGMTLKADFGHWDHGYAVTSHSGQGRTVDMIFIAEGTDSLSAADLRQFYVSVSRGKVGAKVFTDDREALLEAVGVSRDRISAMDLVEPLRPPSTADELDRAIERVADQLGQLDEADELERRQRLGLRISMEM